MGDRAYDKLYLGDIIHSQARLFELVVLEFEHPDIDQFIADYMRGYIRKRLDTAWPRFATDPGNELLDRFIREENYTMPTGMCHMDPDMAYWVGWFYAEYQWYWNVASEDLIRWFSTYELGPRYPGLHSQDMSLIIEQWPPEELPAYDGIRHEVEWWPEGLPRPEKKET